MLLLPPKTGGAVHIEGTGAVGRIVPAGCIMGERARTGSCVEYASGIGKKRFITEGRVAVAGRIGVEREITYGSVRVTNCVVDQSAFTQIGIIEVAAIFANRSHRRRICKHPHDSERNEQKTASPMDAIEIAVERNWSCDK